MRTRDLLTETGSALRANKGKSALTILGIVIGIAAVITMTSLIGGHSRLSGRRTGYERGAHDFDLHGRRHP